MVFFFFFENVYKWYFSFIILLKIIPFINENWALNKNKKLAHLGVKKKKKKHNIIHRYLFLVMLHYSIVLVIL